MSEQSDELTPQKLRAAIDLLTEFYAVFPLVIDRTHLRQLGRDDVENIVHIHGGEPNIYHCSPTGRLICFQPPIQHPRPHFGLHYGMSPHSLINLILESRVKSQIESWENEGGACEKNL